MILKKHIILILCLLSAYSLYGQDKKLKDRKQEIGISSYNMFSTPFGIKANSGLHHNFVNGVSFKSINYDNALRFGLRYLAFKDTYQSSGEGNLLQPAIWDVNYKGLILNTGFEFYLNDNKLQAFIIGDVSISYGNTFEYINTGDEINMEYSIFAFGFSPGVGLRYRIYKNFSITIESGLNAFYIHRSSDTTEPNYNLAFSPLLFSINYCFSDSKQF